MLKLSPQADKIILYVADPLKSYPAFLNTLAQLRKLSGDKINFEKSEMFPLNQIMSQITISHLELLGRASDILELRLHLASLPSSQNNLASYLKNVKKDMSRWAELPQSKAELI